MAGAYFVVRIKGQVDVPYWAETTLRLLKLEKKYRATIVPARENTLGMLNKVKHYVSWVEANSELVRDLIDERGRKSGYKRVTQEDITRAGFADVDDMATALADGRSSLTSLKPLKPWFALAPPRGGFRKSTKRLYGQKGILGHNRDLETLVRSMV